MTNDELLDTAESMLGDAIQMLSEVHQRLGITDDAAWGQTPMGHMRALRRLIQTERGKP